MKRCLLLTTFLGWLCLTPQTLLAQFECGAPVSYQGYSYSTVQIGDQCWFAENCRYLPEVSALSSSSHTEPRYYVVGYEGTDVSAAMETDYYANLGVLYNWSAVLTEDICPSGWHIPSGDEVNELAEYLGGAEVAGYALKSTSGWVGFDGETAGNGSNSSGFNALPSGGYSPYGGGFFFELESMDPLVGTSTHFWLSTTAGPDGNGTPAGDRFGLIGGFDFVTSGVYDSRFGQKARCLLDAE